MRLLIILLFNFFLLISLMAQEKKANQLYEKLGYMSAADYFQSLGEDEQDDAIKLKLANSFRLNGQYDAAEYWYAQIINTSAENEAILHYAQVLQINGKCEDAVRWYESYAEKSGDNNRSFIQNCSEVEQFKYHQNIIVKNQSELNSEYHDFSPIPHGNGLYFTSMRASGKLSTNELDHWTNVGFSDLFYSTKKGDTFNRPHELKGDVNGIYHDGVATFNGAKKEMIFTRNPKKEKGRDGIRRLQLFSASGSDREWKDTKILPFNGNEFSTAHPTFSPDKQQLYFASNRPGGFGGMDIYISRRTGSTWGDPVNLGPVVNTSGNEIFPFMNQKEKLFFASDGHKGIGGLDIFMVEKTDKADENSWASRKNIGSPINSEKDDFGFYIDEAEEQGYFSSNRVGGLGADDIYSWSLDENNQQENPFKSNCNNCNDCVSCAEESKILNIAVCDEDTGERLPDVKVAILKEGQQWLANFNNTGVPRAILTGNRGEEYGIKLNGGIIRADASFVSNQNGEVLYVMNAHKQYGVYCEKEAYYPKQILVSRTELENDPNYCIPLKKRNCIPFEGFVKNKKFDKYIPGVEITLLDKCTGESSTFFTSYDGKISQCLECNCEYELIARKVNFKEARTTINTQNMDCSPNGAFNRVLLLDLEGWNPQNGSVSPDYVNEYFKGDAKGNYQVGDVLTLKNIYYDFDKYNIRADAQYELDYLVTLMTNYPSMEIILASHTDSRGTYNYNTWLSRKRAKSARQYLYDKGIAPYRINGYEAKGEKELKNPCANGIDCLESEHQENRRTEIIITRIDANVSIKE